MPEVQFILNGDHYELSHALVEARLLGVAPEAIREHAVLVNGTWFPIKQAFEVAVGVPRSQFVSQTARRHLASVGFDMRGDATPRRTDVVLTPERQRAQVRNVSSAVDSGSDWYGEANVQATLVTHLTGSGWLIRSVANTATKERGVDIVAECEEHTAGIEVKGFPGRMYADPSRAAEVKRTAPSTQAAHWYAQAILAAMRLRSRKPAWRSVIALPDFPRYRSLHVETIDSLAAAKIEVWWIFADGSVVRP